MGKVLTEMELILEQTQQGISHEVSVSVEGVEELKRKVKIKGVKKEALLTPTPTRYQVDPHGFEDYVNGGGVSSVKYRILKRCNIKLFKNEVLEDMDGTNYLIDSIIDFSPKIDPILEEFADELALINPIPPRIDKVDFDHEGDSQTNTILSYFDDSLPELKTFSLDIEETNSCSTTTHFDYSFPIYEKFSFHDDPTEEKNSGSTTIHAEISLPEYESFNDKSDYVSEMFEDEPPHIMSLPEYDCFYFDIEPDPGKLTRVVVEDIFREPRVHMPNVSPTHPTFGQDLDFTPSYDFSGLNLVASFPSGNRNKTYDSGISIEV
ncbi:hypothetical protein Tco_0668498 [Tanacetum coccineum]